MTVGESALRVDLLEDWKSIGALEPEWNDLLGRSGANSIFLTWEWMRSWADLMKPGARPFVVSVRDHDGALVGLAPLYRATLRLGRAIPYRFLRVMGDFPTGADYPDWISERDRGEAIVPAIVKALEARRGWDFIWMSNMAGWNGSFDRIVAACQAHDLYCRTRPQNFSAFDLPTDKETYFKSLSKNKRQQLKAEMKRIMERPEVEICRCDNESCLPEYLEALFDLHGRRWVERGELGTFKARPQELAFYRSFTPVALRKGWLWLYGLKDEGQFKAIQIGYVYGNVFHQLQEGFDPSYLKGAGNVLRARVIEDCIAHGIREYDFLGDATEHKRRWLGQIRTGHDLLIGRPTLKNRLIFKAGVWPSGRYMHQVSPPLN